MRQVATGCDKFLQVATSSDKLRHDQTSCDQSGRTLSEGPGTFRTLPEGPGTFRKQHRTTIRHTPTGSRGLQGTLGGSRDLPETASDDRKRYQNDRNHENRRNWTQKARNDLRIRPFEAHSHFQSIANLSRPQIPPENPQNPHFPKNPKIRESAGVGGNGRSPFNFKTSKAPEARIS